MNKISVPHRRVSPISLLDRQLRVLCNRANCINYTSQNRLIVSSSPAVGLLLNRKIARLILMSKIKEQNFEALDGKLITIRTAKEADAEGYLNLCKSIMAEDIYFLTQPDEFTLTVEQEREWLQSHIENENHLVLVAEVEEEIIGQLDFSNGCKKRIAHTGGFGIGVHKDYRGLSIGTRLLEALLHWANQHPLIEKVNLCVHSTNERAITMYEKHGFRKEGARLRDLKYGENNFVDTILMGKIINRI